MPAKLKRNQVDRFDMKLITRDFVFVPADRGVFVYDRKDRLVGKIEAIDEVASIRNYLSFQLNRLRERAKKDARPSDR